MLVSIGCGFRLFLLPPTEMTEGCLSGVWESLWGGRVVDILNSNYLLLFMLIYTSWETVLDHNTNGLPLSQPNRQQPQLHPSHPPAPPRKSTSRPFLLSRQTSSADVRPTLRCRVPGSARVTWRMSIASNGSRIGKVSLSRFTAGHMKGHSSRK